MDGLNRTRTTCRHENSEQLTIERLDGLLATWQETGRSAAPMKVTLASWNSVRGSLLMEFGFGGAVEHVKFPPAGQPKVIATFAVR